jgi:hypothetical protein
VDVELSSDDETNVPTDHKAPAADDAGNVGVASTEANAPIVIMADAHEMPKSPAADHLLVVPPSGRHDRKHMSPASRRSNPVPQTDKVMTQVELPPYH